MADTLPPVISVLDLDASGFLAGLDSIVDALTDLVDRAEDTGDEMGEMFAPAEEAASSAAAEIDGAADTIAESFDAIDESARAAADSVVESFSGMRDDLDDAGAGIGESFDASFDTIKGAADDTAQLVAGAFDDADDRIRGAADTLGEGFDAALDSITDSADRTAADMDASMSAAMDSVRAQMEETAARGAESMAAMRDSTVASMGDTEAAVAAGLGGGALAGTRDLKDAEDDAEDDSAGFSDRVSKMFKSIGNTLGGLGIPMSESFTKMGDKIEEAESQGKGFEQSLTSLAHVTTGVLGVGFLAAGAEGIHMASDFQSASEHLVTDAGESQRALKGVENGMLNISAATGTAQSSIVDGMYHIESSGYHGAAALKILSVAAEGAKTGGANLDDVAKTLTGTMKAYNIPAGQAVNVMNELIATVGSGDMRMQDLSTALGSVTSIAAAAHIPISQVGGAIATMTARNMTAQRATNDLANTINALTSPSNVAKSEMASLGLNSQSLQEHLGSEGLTGTLNEMSEAVLKKMGPAGLVLLKTFNQTQAASSDLTRELAAMPPAAHKVSEAFEDGRLTGEGLRNAIKALPANQAEMVTGFESTYNAAHKFNSQLTNGSYASQTYNSAMKNMLNGATGLNTALMLTGANAGQFADNVKHIQGAADGSSKAVAGYSKIQQTMSQQLDVAKEHVAELLTKLGDALIPVLEHVISVTASVVEWFTRHATTAKVLASIIGGVLAIAIGKTLYDAMAKMVGTIGKVGDALVGFGKKALGIGSSTEEGAATADEAMGAAADKMQAAADQIAAAADQIAESMGQVGESTEGAAEEGEASLDELMAAFNETAEEGAALAERIAPSLDELMEAFNSTATEGQELAERLSVSFDEIEESMMALGPSAEAASAEVDAAFETMGDTGEVLAAEGPEIGEGVSAMFGPIGMAIQILIPLIMLLMQHWRLVWGIIKDVGLDAWHAIDGVFHDIENVVMTVVDTVVDFVRDHWKLIVALMLGPIGIVVGLIATYWHQILQGVEDAWHDISSAITAAVDTVVDFVKDHWKLLIAIILGPLGVIVDLIVDNWQTIESTTETVFDAIKSFLTDNWQDIESVATTVWDGISSVITTSVSNLENSLETDWQDIEDAAVDAWDFVKDHIGIILPAIMLLITGPVGALPAFMATHWQMIANATNTAWNDIKSYVGSAMSGLASVVSSGISEVMGYFDALPGDIEGALGGIAGDMVGIGESIVSGIVSGIESMAGAVMSAIESIIPHGGILGKIASKLIPGWATGGIVTKPTLGVVGEAGPEAVIPLMNGIISVKGINDSTRALAGLPGGYNDMTGTDTANGLNLGGGGGKIVWPTPPPPPRQIGPGGGGGPPHIGELLWGNQTGYDKDFRNIFGSLGEAKGILDPILTKADPGAGKTHDRTVHDHRGKDHKLELEVHSHVHINGQEFYEETWTDLRTVLLQKRRQVVELGLG